MDIDIANMNYPVMRVIPYHCPTWEHELDVRDSDGKFQSYESCLNLWILSTIDNAYHFVVAALGGM